MSIEKIDLYLDEIKNKLLKAIARLESSIQRLPSIKNSIDDFTDEELGLYEEFMSRFGRLSDIFLSQYIRTQVKKSDPAFRGSFKDFLDQAEKLSYIDSSEEWYKIRELRNRQAHEYEDKDLIGLFKDTLNQVDRLRLISKLLTNAPKTK